MALSAPSRARELAIKGSALNALILSPMLNARLGWRVMESIACRFRIVRWQAAEDCALRALLAMAARLTQIVSAIIARMECVRSPIVWMGAGMELKLALIAVREVVCLARMEKDAPCTQIVKAGYAWPENVSSLRALMPFKMVWRAVLTVGEIAARALPEERVAVLREVKCGWRDELLA